MGEPNEQADSERSIVQQELSTIRNEIEDVRFEDFAKSIKSGNWFAGLLASSLRNYADTATPEFFADKYPGLPPDAVVDRQVALAKRYAGIAGGVTSSAYTTAIAATIGSKGGASPWTVPAALTAMGIDLFYLTRLQLRLAYDMSVLYAQPANIEDPEDLYELIKVAFGVKTGEVALTAINKVVPEATRQGVRAVVRGATLKSLQQSLPVVGKSLLQRHVIKFAIPAVGVPLTVGLNVLTTGFVAKTARQIYRDKALADEKAKEFVDCLPHHELLISVVWAAIQVDGPTSAEEMWFLRNLIRFADEVEGFCGDGDDLGIGVDVESLCCKAAELSQDDRDSLFEAACLAVTIDRKVHRKEKEFLEMLAVATGVEWDPGRLKEMVRDNKV